MKSLKNFLKRETSINLGYIGLSKVGSIVLGLFTIALSARGLGVEKFGILALFLSLVELANVLTLPGFNSILNKSLHQKNYSFYKKAYQYSVFSSIFLGALSSIILFILFKFFNLFQEITFHLALFAIAFVAVRNLDKSDAILPAVKNFRLQAILAFLSSLARFLGIGLTSYMTGNIFTVIKIYLIGQLLVSVISFYYIRNILKPYSSLVNHHEYLNDSFKMNILEFFNIGVAQIDKILLYQLSPMILGVFQAAFSYPEKIKDVFITLVSTVTNSWLSYGNDEFKKRAISNSLFGFVFIFSIFAILYVAPPYYIPILLGDKFIAAIPIARFAAFIVVIKIINTFFQSRDIVFGDISRHQYKIVSFKAVYLLLVFLTIKNYGPIGIIVALTVSELFFLMTLLYDFKREVSDNI